MARNLALLCLLALCRCSILEPEAQRGVYQGRNFTTPAAYTDADVRMVTQRTNPVTHDETVCVEPSPDVAKALSSSVSAQLQGGNGAATAGIGAQAASGEALAELAGRSTALLGLRDGLFRACEAYANGAIGQDAYGLVLARYGQLMTTLFLAQDITAAAAAVGKPGTAATIQAQAASQTAGTAGAIVAAPKPAPGALALTRMNEDYIHEGQLGLLLVACINEFDPTRAGRGARNGWLQDVCNQMRSVDRIFGLAADEAAAAHWVEPAAPAPGKAG